MRFTICGGIIKEIPFVFGQIIEYLYGVNDGKVWPIVFVIMSVILLALCITIIASRVGWSKD